MEPVEITLLQIPEHTTIPTIATLLKQQPEEEEQLNTKTTATITHNQAELTLEAKATLLQDPTAAHHTVEKAVEDPMVAEAVAAEAVEAIDHQAEAEDN